MEIIAFVGPSGTGKSHRALVVAHDYHVDAIIDDGLYIKDNKIAAGHSAKKEPNKIGAVRRAIFMDEEHVNEVKQAIAETKPEKILILGTSDNMIGKIVAALDLPPVSKTVRIEHVATPDEIAKARASRLKEGKHIIPVPTIELKPHFSGYMIDPLQIFLKRPQMQRRRLGEKSIVRPTFSYFGKLTISDSAIEQLVQHIVLQNDAVAQVPHVKTTTNTSQKEKGLIIRMDLVMRHGISLRPVIAKVQHEVKEHIEYISGMTVREINVVVRSLAVE